MSTRSAARSPDDDDRVSPRTATAHNNPPAATVDQANADRDVNRPVTPAEFDSLDMLASL
jgi:hypothetical protein